MSCFPAPASQPEPFGQLLTKYYCLLISSASRHWAEGARAVGRKWLGKSGCLLLTVLSINLGYGQGDAGSPPGLSKIIPPSPNAAALGRYGEVPVGFYTGLPSITVPLYEVASGGITVPVALNYRASGIRVDDLGSWVGIGWSLDGGGVIARTVHGLADETPGIGYRKLATEIDKYFLPERTINQRHQLLDYAARNRWDLEPDVYSFNFAGHSGQFVFDHNGQPVALPYQKLLIVERTDTSGFNITTEDGTRFIFLSQEHSYAEPLGQDDMSPDIDAPSSWYLTRIEPLVGHPIKFIYSDPSNIIYPVNTSETRYVLQSVDSPNVPIGTGRLDDNRSYSQLTVSAVTLSAIVTHTQRVNFYSSQRFDLKGALKVDSIRVVNAQGRALKRWHLKYNLLSKLGRLRLEQVQEKGAATGSGSYKFVYNPLALPPVNARGSGHKGQDHWGYYTDNGNYSALHNTLIPAMSITVEGQKVFW